MAANETIQADRIVIKQVAVIQERRDPRPVIAKLDPAVKQAVEEARAEWATLPRDERRRRAAAGIDELFG